MMMVLLGIMILGISVSAYAQDNAKEKPTENNYPDKEKVVKVEKLTPQKGSDVVALLELIHYDDKSTAVHISASGDSSTQMETIIEVSIDPTDKTYMAKTEQAARPAAPSAVAAVYFHEVKISSWDPIQVQLTQTYASYGWTSNPNGTISPNPNHSCWSGNPTSAGTHWYTDTCYKNIYMAPAKNEGSVQATGKFSNSDWKFPSQSTYLHQWVYLSGRHNGTWGVDGWQRATGEDSGLISFKFAFY